VVNIHVVKHTFKKLCTCPHLFYYSSAFW